MKSTLDRESDQFTKPVPLVDFQIPIIRDFFSQYKEKYQDKISSFLLIVGINYTINQI